MLEKDERFLPGLTGDSLSPVAQVRVAVLRTTQAEVSPFSSGDKRNLQLIVGVRQAKGRVVLAKKGKDFLVEPRLMPELHRGRPFPREQAEKIAQAGEV